MGLWTLDGLVVRGVHGYEHELAISVEDDDRWWSVAYYFCGQHLQCRLYDLRVNVTK